MTRRYPDERVSDFPKPPAEIVDHEDREIAIRVLDADEAEDLVGMYLEFNPEDRAQGIPPVEEPQIRDWVDSVCIENGHSVVAWYDEDIVGHAMLVDDDTGAAELAVFVLRDYQGARIGTALCETLLGHAQTLGLERIWLSVERWNEPAIRLYQNLGFQRTEQETLELEMTMRLEPE